MQLKAIKVGEWYETTRGVGRAVKVGGTFPPSVKVNIMAPSPLGTVLVSPRDVKRKLSNDELPPEARQVAP